MGATQGVLGLGRERAFADGTCDEIKEFLGDHEPYFTLRHVGQAGEALVREMDERFNIPE
jgi:hypothetical protein